MSIDTDLPAWPETEAPAAERVAPTLEPPATPGVHDEPVPTAQLTPSKHRLRTTLRRARQADPGAKAGLIVLALGTLILFWKLGGFVLPSDSHRTDDSGPKTLWQGITDWLQVWRWGRGNLLKSTTPTGGDMGAHVWTPDFVQRSLFPKGRLTGWSNDWFAGTPVLGFYFPLPALTIAALAYVIPYGIAFKLISVLGILSLPVACWGAGCLSGVRRPIPVLMGLAAFPFLLGRNYADQMYGGNIASTMAGEFSFSISLSLSLLFLGLLVRVLRTGRGRAISALVLAAIGLCHLLPTMWVLGASALLLLTYLDRHEWRRQLRDSVLVFATGGLVAGFWLIPFAHNLAYTNDMGWERTNTYLGSLFPWWAKTPWEDAGLMAGGLALGAIGVLGAVASLLRSLTRRVRSPQPWSRSARPFTLGVVVASLSLGLIGRTPGAWIGAGGLLVICTLIIGIVEGLDYDRFAVFLACLAGTCAAVFVQAPQFRLWNARALPFWFLTCLLLGARGCVTLVHAVTAIARSIHPPRRSWRAAPAWGTAGVAALVFVGVGVPLNLVPDATPIPKIVKGHLSIQRASETTDANYAIDWAAYNYSGYQEQKGWKEYRGIMTLAAKVGRENGCGRTMWEYDDEKLESFGTTMSLMLLPFWTKGCIGSMEGVYFESSATAPYHWMNAALLTVPETKNADGSIKFSGASNPQRGLPYPSFDLERGIEKLRAEGVRYYLAFTQPTLDAADASRNLRRVGSTGQCPAVDGKSCFTFYEIRRSALVAPLTEEPAVVTGIGQNQDGGWLDIEMDQYVNPAKYPESLVWRGPKSWARLPVTVKKPKGDTNYGKGISILASPAARLLPAVKVSNIKETNTDITFTVDRVGVPVVVRTSYFPNWVASGATGPYRVMPNFMVVVPTGTTVRLHYGYSGADLAGHGATAAGLAGAVMLHWTRRRRRASRSADVPSPPAADQDSPRPSG